MVDTARSFAEIQSLLPHNLTGAISAQDLRDLVQSIRTPVAAGVTDAYAPGVNVKHRGAKGDSVSDDTPKFIAACQESKDTTGTISLIIPPGGYVLDGQEIIDSAIGADLALNGGYVRGAGHQATQLIAKAGARCAFGARGILRWHFQDIGFFGRGSGQPEKGFILEGNSQGIEFESCSFRNAAVGCELTFGTGGAGAANQADKNTFINCYAQDSGTGLWLNAGNGQCQLWLGGSFDSNSISMRSTSGWFQQIGGMVQHGGGQGTAYLLDGGSQFLMLEDVITEGEAISIDVQGMTTPAVVTARSCYFQGLSAGGGIRLNSGRFHAEHCRFNTIVKVGSNSWFYDFNNDWAAGTFDRTGAENDMRDYYALGSGRRTLTINGSNALKQDEVGTIRSYFRGSGYGATLQAGVKFGGAPIDADFSATGVEDGMFLIDNDGNRLWVRKNGAWESIPLHTPSLATTATTGFQYIPTCAGTPTGVPSAQTGMVPMVYDTTNHKFYIYDGGWKGGTNPGAFT